MASKGTAALEAMIEEATVDAYGDDQQLTGLFTMIEEHLAVPFTTTVLGVEVTVRKVDLTADSIVAVCARGRHQQRIDLLDPAATHSRAGRYRVDRRLPALGREVGRR
ncbi:calcium-binding protein [Verrucosispora sp. NA02020]|uniref:calcium-binding protein n=1 Tax=Verrucosispora sp. NA02020 TaxID=2742132 RepID=UPI0020CA7462|nr:calcium-binding protein [Verrucosispora sp. NA02020]